MPTRNVHLTPEHDRFIAEKIADGTCTDASAVINAALRTLEREEHEYREKLAALRAAIDEGVASETAQGDIHDVFARVRQRHGLPMAEL